MNQIKICSPGGAGGAWLSHLIYCLENNIPTTKPAVNYHRTTGSDSVVHSHDVYDKSQVFFTSQHIFNIYLNVIKKFWITDQDILNKLTVAELFETLSNETMWKFSFLEERIDLCWDDIFLCPSKFEHDLFKALDQHNLSYTANHELFHCAVNEYKSTCVNPAEHFDNFDSILWLGWCNGVCRQLNQEWILADTVEQMQQFLAPRQEFFRDYTKQYMLEFHEQT